VSIKWGPSHRTETYLYDCGIPIYIQRSDKLHEGYKAKNGRHLQIERMAEEIRTLLCPSHRSPPEVKLDDGAILVGTCCEDFKKAILLLLSTKSKRPS
jgi:hypothetical protein